MKITLAGRDRTDEMAPSLREAAERFGRDPRCAFLPPHLSALSLREARSEAEYDERFAKLIRGKLQVSLAHFDFPHRPGLLGSIQKRMRAFLWKLLRYQQDRLVFRLNAANACLEAALEFDRAARRRLERRVDELEKRLGGP